MDLSDLTLRNFWLKRGMKSTLFLNITPSIIGVGLKTLIVEMTSRF